ncbi:hypothetical protein ABGB17_18495 [Sphaerisporangium sp. B11E5]|uniref:hypothetical protein n=1 Tax=Sphaerisporangium sp. B11E5 TaxID=3153563 RepID=UPI00325EF337
MSTKTTPAGLDAEAIKAAINRAAILGGIVGATIALLVDSSWRAALGHSTERGRWARKASRVNVVLKGARTTERRLP